LNEGGSERKTPHAVVVNTVLMNGGDAAILIAVVEQLRAVLGPATRVTVLDLFGTGARAYYPDLDIEEATFSIPGRRAGSLARRASGLFRLVPALAAATAFAAGVHHEKILRACPSFIRRRLELFLKADVIISTGGTYLVEHYRLLPKVFDLFLANALKRPLILFTQSLGPFSTRQNRALIRAALEPARLILLRDERSLEHLREAGIDTARCAVRADSVFGLGHRERVAASAEIRLPARGLKVAISVRDWSKFRSETAEAGMRRYTAAVAALCRELIDRDAANVTFVSTCQGIPEYEQHDDRVASSIVEILPARYHEHLRVDSAFHEPRALLELLGEFDLVVSTRMHVAILALIAGRPVLPIAYEFKTRELFQRLGFPGWVADIDTLDAESLCQTYRRLSAELDAARPALARGVVSCIDDALSTCALVERALA
jgi:colanic acid/amylovoran biosynthesis protein